MLGLTNHREVLNRNTIAFVNDFCFQLHRFALQALSRNFAEPVERVHLLHSFRVYFYIFSTRFECIFYAKVMFATVNQDIIFVRRRVVILENYITKLKRFAYEAQGEYMEMLVSRNGTLRLCF